MHTLTQFHWLCENGLEFFKGSPQATRNNAHHVASVCRLHIKAILNDVTATSFTQLHHTKFQLNKNDTANFIYIYIFFYCYYYYWEYFKNNCETRLVLLCEMTIVIVVQALADKTWKIYLGSELKVPSLMDQLSCPPPLPSIL